MWIHLVLKSGWKKKKTSPTMKSGSDTFPAGTLSGAPKHRAVMQLIEKI